jgi:HK97 family phage major capsid protein
MLATATGEKVKTLRGDLDKLMALDAPSAEDLEKAVKLNEELDAVEQEYIKLKGVDDAAEARRLADEKQRRQDRSPIIRPGFEQGDQRGNLDAERQMKQLRGTGERQKSWTELFGSSEAYKAARKQGHFQGMSYVVEVEDYLWGQKAAGDPVMSSQFNPIATDFNIVPHVFPPTTVIPLIPTQTVSVPSIRYFPAGPITGAAAGVPEGTAKPEVQPRWSQVDALMETIADWSAVTLQALDDLPQLRSNIDFDLRRSVEIKLDNLILNGTGTPPDFKGILPTTGVQSVTFSAGTSQPDMIAKGIALIVSTGNGMPNAVVMNPTDWWNTRVSKAPGSGVYYFGSPAEVGVSNLFGVPVVQDQAMPVGTALVGDFNYAMLYIRQGLTFIVGLKNDDILRNQMTIVCEMRATLAVRRPAAFAKVALV